ncbi:hypothetical protein AALO_G00052750 [Alosa alosa]|uniref:SCA7 domain-containing protein n=1 Tax=Alosa alosa TaxID=278164 RepID=A0AAV6H4G4_9TELE|nr:hypothetical protein AALO_G00052750 [Alosa alosa]
MMAVRARAAAVMAASDRRSSIPVEFVGQSWSSWIDKTNVSASEASNTEECSKNVKKRMETMTLRKEDMSIYGHCPAHDDFFPGGVQSLWTARDGRWQEPGSPRAPPPPATHRPTKAQKEGASALPGDKLSQGTPPSPPHSSAPSPRDPPWRHGAVQPSAPSPGEKPLQKGMQGPPVDVLSPLRGPRTYSRTYKKVHSKGKELDLDKHCGVLDPERKKVCTRLLTCNIHSIHQRRQVVGRSKNFDQLVTELKMGSKARERAPVLRETLETEPPCSETPVSQTGPPHCKRQPNHVNLRPRTPSESAVEEEMEVPAEVEEPTPQSNNHSRLSSDESEGEGQEETLDLPFSPWHPKPLGLCTFGSRALSCSVFTFDRRLHHLRSAVSAMVEQHISAHLWKKIPQVADTRPSRTPAAVASVPSSQDPSGGASTRASAASSSSSSSSSPALSSLRTSSSSLPPRAGRENTSGQSETKGIRPAAALGPGRPKNPVGRPSKQQLRQRELERSRRAEAGASPGTGGREEQSPSSARGSAARGYERQEERAFVASPDKSTTPASSRRPVNGALSLLSKPRPTAHTAQARSPSLAKRPAGPPSGHAPSTPPEHSSRGGGGGAGTGAGSGAGPHRRPDGYDHKGLGKKRKASGVSPPVTPSQPPKSLGLSSPSHSSFFSWKKDSKGAAASLGLEKKLDTQKPKLHH